MFQLQKPSPASIERTLRSLVDAPYSHDHAGATKSTPPQGFTIDRYGVELGSGIEIFDRACAGLRRFAMYPGWTTVYRLGSEVAPGRLFATVVSHLGFWSVNPCRIVYTFDEPGPAPRFGFAIGTLPGHAEAGEERFEVSYSSRTDVVRYDVLAFSRPARLLSRIGALYARRLQRRFAVDACAAMEAVVSPPRDGLEETSPAPADPTRADPT